MGTLLSTRGLVILTGFILIFAAAGSWVMQDLQPHEEIRSFSSGEKHIIFSDQGKEVAVFFVQTFPQQYYNHAVPVRATLEINSSRYHVDAVDIRIYRPEMGDVYFQGYQKELPAQFWRENDGHIHVMSLQTAGFWGESNQVFDFMVPLRDEEETITVAVDARISETGPFWRHGWIRSGLPVTINLTAAGIT